RWPRQPPSPPRSSRELDAPGAVHVSAWMFTADVHDADRIISLYCLGFEIDERADERLMEFKRTGTLPMDALPGLKDVISDEWNSDHFAEWLEEHGSVDSTKVPAGRRLKGQQPASLELTISHLVAGMHPLSDSYPLPHYRRSI
ncbi:MAG TPA: BREX-6 system BrxE protein, partial [Planctomycetaceae bacterium]|nr:BREX-6 system BrxE protein [Planctomycetaceae bacterium]